MADISNTLSQQIKDAHANKQVLNIQGNDSKKFYGNPCKGQSLHTSTHTGIITYEPTELVITARAGTSLQDINQTLADQNQILGFEPPDYGNSTLGGTIACNLSGPRRPYAGAARDFVLGCRIINGKGDIMHFGGEVMKNVAGYDVARLMAGAMGTLGVLLDISLKILPRPQSEITIRQQLTEQQALSTLTQLRSQPIPITAACFVGASLHIRLSGNTTAINAAHKKIGGELIADSEHFWQSIREHQHTFFNNTQPLWRLSLPPATNINLDGKTMIDWGGAQRWLFSDLDAEHIRGKVNEVGGHATLYKNSTTDTEYFHPLDNTMLKVQQQLKKSFDPENILNPGKLYRAL